MPSGFVPFVFGTVAWKAPVAGTWALFIRPIPDGNCTEDKGYFNASGRSANPDAVPLIFAVDAM